MTERAASSNSSPARTRSSAAFTAWRMCGLANSGCRTLKANMCRAGSGSRTVGQLRYAYRKLLDLVGGTDAEAEIQAGLAADLSGIGLEVDHWQLPLAELMAEHVRETKTGVRHAEDGQPGCHLTVTAM